MFENSWWTSIQRFLHFQQENRKNFYPCKLTGEFKIDNSDQTWVRFKDLSNGSTFELTTKEIFEDKKLLDNFCPTDISRITIIAFGEIFFSLPADERKSRFEDLRKKTLESITKDEK